MCSKKKEAILSDKPLKLVDLFIFFGNNISSSENDAKVRLAKASTTIVWLTILWKSVLSEKIRRGFFQTVTMLVLMYSCTISKKTHGQKTRWNICKYATYFCEQILEETLHKVAAIRAPTSHLTSHPR